MSCCLVFLCLVSLFLDVFFLQISFYIYLIFIYLSTCVLRPIVLYMPIQNCSIDMGAGAMYGAVPDEILESQGNDKWQHWMDVQFGHTQDQVAARRL